MSTLSFVRSAIKGKAPIAAIPVEGHAPACVDRKRLAAWSKGVTITRVEVVQEPSITRHEPKRPYTHPYDEHGRHIGGLAEGPWERVEYVEPGSRYLIIEGTAGRVKTRCRMVLIDRRTAIKTLSAWSEKERARLLKRTMLGALAKDTKRAIKLVAHGDHDGAASVTIHLARFGKNVTGVPVTLPGFETAECVVHPSMTEGYGWSVTERYTGLQIGSGKTAEGALAEAGESLRKATPAGMASALARIAEAKLAALAVAA